ncbi:MAG: type I-U CRISPR-associated protein Csx17 [Cyanobacteria bacterium P01_H01_bin.152]
MTVTATVNAVTFPHLLPTTAIGWLKAIGLLRLSNASGSWENDCFQLEINSAESLVEDILHNYQPKPFVSPWNSYSLFNKADGLAAVLAAKSERYALMQAGYQKIQSAIEPVDRAGQASEQMKKTLVPYLRKTDSAFFQEWLNAVGLLTSTQKGPRFLCNDLLGTGGNVGTTDFCTVYFQVCSQLWDLETGEPSPATEAYIRASVLGESIPDTLMLQGMLGHTYPAADYFDDLAPSATSQADYLDNGGRSSQLANPVDLILYLEGAATFTGKAIARNEVKQEGDQEYTIAAYPLLLEVNSGSADTSDRTGRAYEVWLPLWDDPLHWEDFQELATRDLSFRLKYQVVDTLDMLDVITQVDEYRGLPRFSRFGLWPRKGQGKYLVYVGLATPGEIDFGAELRAWRLKARPTDKQSQAQYTLLTAIQKALYQLQQGNDEATTVIRLLGQLELLHSRIKPKSVPSVPQLKTSWIEAVYREYPIVEVELAAALASASLVHKTSGHELPFRRSLSSARFSQKTEGWFWSSDHTDKLKTASLEALCLSLLKLWQATSDYHPSHGWTLRASPDAIATFIAGRTNDQLILELAMGFALCRIPQKLGTYSTELPLPEPYKYAASLQWTAQTNLTAQTINGLLMGSTLPLQRQLSAVQKPVVLPDRIATGDRSALALVFPCKPFHPFGETHD